MRDRTTYIINILLIALFAVSLGVFLIGMPKYSDDYWYMQSLSDWYFRKGVTDLNGAGPLFSSPFPWNEIFDTWRLHWQIDNIRLGNLLVVFFLMLPKWIGSSIALLVWIYSMLVSYKLADIDLRKSALVLLGLVLWGVFLPWSNRLGSLVFQFNYVLGTGITLLFIYFLKLDGPDQNNNSVFLLLITGLIAGWWQEAFSIAVFVGLIAIMAISPSHRNKRYTAALAGLCIGILIGTVTPGTATRMAWYSSFTTEAIKAKLLYIIAYNLPYYFLLLLIVWNKWRDRKVELWGDKLLMFAVVSGCVPILITLVVYVEPRVTWWTQIISIIAIMRILNKNFAVYWKGYALRNGVWLAPAAVLMFAHLIFSDIYVLKMRSGLERAVTDYLRNPDKSVFGQTIEVKDQPLICAKMPDVLFYSGVDHQLSSILSKLSGQTNFSIIPEELREADSKSGREVGQEQNIRDLGGFLFMAAGKNDLPPYTRIEFEVDYGNGKRKVAGYASPFMSEKDGKRYYYLSLMAPWLKQHFGTIKSVRVLNHA